LKVLRHACTGDDPKRKWLPQGVRDNLGNHCNGNEENGGA